MSKFASILNQVVTPDMIAEVLTPEEIQIAAEEVQQEIVEVDKEIESAEKEVRYLKKYIAERKSFVNDYKDAYRTLLNALERSKRPIGYKHNPNNKNVPTAIVGCLNERVTNDGKIVLTNPEVTVDIGDEYFCADSGRVKVAEVIDRNVINNTSHYSAVESLFGYVPQWYIEVDGEIYKVAINHVFAGDTVYYKNEIYTVDEIIDDKIYLSLDVWDDVVTADDNFIRVKKAEPYETHIINNFAIKTKPKRIKGLHRVVLDGKLRDVFSKELSAGIYDVVEDACSIQEKEEGRYIRKFYISDGEKHTIDYFPIRVTAEIDGRKHTFEYRHMQLGDMYLKDGTLLLNDTIKNSLNRYYVLLDGDNDE